MSGRNELSIPFTQYLMPDGRKADVWIDRPAEISQMARRLTSAGYVFEIEMLSDYETVSIEILKPNPDDDPDVLTHEICPNGPAVPVVIDKMVMDSIGKLEELAKGMP